MHYERSYYLPLQYVELIYIVDIIATSLNLGINWRWGFSSEPRSWYPKKGPRYLFYLSIRIIRISKEYNLEIATEKTKVFGFVETDHLRTKIIINDETQEQVSQFTYLSCSISYQFSNDVEFKLATFLQLNGTIKGNIFRKLRTESILKICNTLVLPTFLYVVRKLDSDSLTETKNWSGRNEVIETSGRLHPFMTTKQMTPYAVNYRLNAYWTT